jgi:hypothetical protein
MLTWFFAALMAGVAHAQTFSQVPLAPVEGQYHIQAEYEYFISGANYCTGAELFTCRTNTLPGNGHFSTSTERGLLTYDIMKNIRAYGGVSGGQTSADVPDPLRSNLSVNPPIIITNPHTSQGFAKAWLGGQFWWQIGDFDLVPQVDLTMPFFQIDDNYHDPLLGQGATEVQGGAWMRWQHWNELTFFGYMGGDYRDGTRSSLVTYYGGGRYQFQHIAYAEGGLRGYDSITDDAKSNSSLYRFQRDNVLTSTDGGSYQYYSINPGRGEVVGYAGGWVGPVEIYAGAYYSVYGRNTADGWGAFGGVKFTGALYQTAKPAKGGFEQKPEKYDEQLFQENPAPVAPVDESVPETPPETPAKPAKKKPKAGEPMPNVEQLMKDTEKTLEKKGN